MTEFEFRALVAAARLRNIARDYEDKLKGLATPSDVGPVGLVAAARDAIEASIRAGDRDCAAEAYALLAEAVQVLGAKHG